MLPIVFSMSRYLYIDFALTALVAVNVCLLLQTERFGRKGYALLYGLSLGLGLLTKWTFVAFAAAPLLAALASRELLAATGRALRPAAWDRRRLLVAAAIGLGLTALWFLPNVEATAALPLGYALVPLSWLVWTLTGYFALSPSQRGANLLAALGLGLAVASAWYLTKINFLGEFWLNAYGKPSGRSWGFGQYVGFLYREQLSPILALVLVLALAGLVWHRWRRSGSLRRTGSWRRFLALGLEGWVLVLWAVIPFVIFSSRVSIVHSRYIMPLLPPLGIAVALGLSRVRPRWLRATLVGAVAAMMLIQFVALSFDALDPLRQAAPVLADGLSIQPPASGRTDAGYWVAPDVLQYVQDHRDTDPARLGILVNRQQVNGKQFIYLVYADFPGVQIDELATIGRDNPAYPRLFEEDFVLLVDPPPDHVRRPDTVETTERLLTRPDDTFHRAFDLAASYPLPDGSRLLLYQRRLPTPPDTDPAFYQSLMADLAAAARPGDALLAMPPEQVYALGRFGDGSLPIYPLAQADPAALAQVSAEYERLWLVLGEGAPAREALLGWLAENAYLAADAWYGPVQLLLYAPGPGTEPGPLHAGELMWDNGVRLQRSRFLDSSLPLGSVIRLDLEWQADEPVPVPYKVFVHLLDGAGRVVSQRDSEPLDGQRPTTTWTPGEPVADRYGLLLPTDLPAGDYRIVLGLYDPESGERAPACCPQADALLLARLRVEGGVARILPETDW